VNLGWCAAWLRLPQTVALREFQERGRVSVLGTKNGAADERAAAK
jgi:hypothetical protein